MKNIVIITGILFNIQVLFSQNDTVFVSRPVGFREYLDMVRNNNLEYAAEKFNVSIADAAVQIARIIPDPYASVDVTANKENGLSTGLDYAAEAGTTLEIGGKRRARIALAESERDLARAELADYFRNLQAEAALNYLEAIRQKQVYKVGYNSYLTMKRLSEADSIRFQLGTIMKIDAIQSKLEAGNLFNDLIHSRNEWKNSLLQILMITGRSDRDTLLIPEISQPVKCRLFSHDDLVVTALNNRADLLAARASKKVSQNALTLARKEKIADLGIRSGFSSSYFSGTRVSSGLSGGIEIPIKISSLSKGTVRMAQMKINQAEELYSLVENQIKTDINQTWNLYYVHCRQVENFENGLLLMASDVLKGKLYSYERGETSLLDVLNAQRTYNDIQITYYNALYDMAAALVNLEKAAGIWDLEF